jgi:plastocyanin
MIQRRGGVPWLAAALVAVSGVVAGVSVAAASAPEADVTVNATVSNTWDQPTVNVNTGDTVTWNYNAGNSIPHNTESVDGPPEDPAWADFQTEVSTGTGAYQFTKPGTYNYLCTVHREAMIGSVIVTGAAVTPTGTPSATRTPTPTRTATPGATRTPTPTPVVDDRLTPAPTGSASLDKTAPAVTSFSLKAVRRGATVRFTLSEPSAVTIRFKKGSKTLRTARLSARAGKRAVTVRGAKLVKGRYSVEIEARDARGNRAPMARKTVRVTR